MILSQTACGERDGDPLAGTGLHADLALPILDAQAVAGPLGFEVGEVVTQSLSAAARAAVPRSTRASTPGSERRTLRRTIAARRRPRTELSVLTRLPWMRARSRPSAASTPMRRGSPALGVGNSCFGGLAHALVVHRHDALAALALEWLRGVRVGRHGDTREDREQRSDRGPAPAGRRSRRRRDDA